MTVATSCLDSYLLSMSVNMKSKSNKPRLNLDNCFQTVALFFFLMSVIVICCHIYMKLQVMVLQYWLPSKQASASNA